MERTNDIIELMNNNVGEEKKKREENRTLQNNIMVPQDIHK